MRLNVSNQSQLLERMVGFVRGNLQQDVVILT